LAHYHVHPKAEDENGHPNSSNWEVSDIPEGSSKTAPPLEALFTHGHVCVLQLLVRVWIRIPEAPASDVVFLEVELVYCIAKLQVRESAYARITEWQS
jgi:hypothetical protein